MDKDVGRVGDAEQALVQAPSPTVSAASGFDPSRDEANTHPLGPLFATLFCCFWLVVIGGFLWLLIR